MTAAAGTCCIFQPFDDGPFDKRYDEVVAPAVMSAGLDPYRVDRDASATIPIDELHEQVQSSAVCLADITTDNPNVWYELGYAIGRNKPVVMICSAHRPKFPFDIQHRRIILYRSDSPTDFAKLRSDITNALNAEVQKNRVISSPLKERHGLREHEIAALAFIMANLRTNNWISKLSEDMDRAGFTRLATNLALDVLQKKGLIMLGKTMDERTQEESEAALLTDAGSNWLNDNQDELVQPRLINR